MGKYEGLWLTNRATTRGWVYGFGSFAILSLRFFLTSATGADFPVENCPWSIPGLAFGRNQGTRRQNLGWNQLGDPIMPRHPLAFEQWVRFPQKYLFAFFSNAENLPRIMPSCSGTKRIVPKPDHSADTCSGRRRKQVRCV